MAWTTPATFTVGEVVTASKLNTHVRDNLRYLKGLDGAVTIQAALTAQGAITTTGVSAIDTGTDTRLELYTGSATEARIDAANAAYSGFKTLRFTALALQFWANAAERITVDTGGNVGLGATSPQGRLHAAQSPGGFLVFCRTGITSAVTILASGAVRRISLWGVVHRVSGGVNQIVNGLSAISGGTADIFTDGGSNILRVTNTAGAVTVARAAGSDSYDVVLFCAYQ